MKVFHNAFRSARRRRALTLSLLASYYSLVLLIFGRTAQAVSHRQHKHGDCEGH
jgi:hypothetical protein